MAGEITVGGSVTVRKPDSTDNTKILVDENIQIGFKADMAGTSGPFGGTILVPVTYYDLSSILSAAGGGGGVATFKNQSPTYLVQVGLYDVSENVFEPFLDILPNETWPCRLATNLGQEEIPGTGTSGSLFRTRLAMKASGGTAPVLVKMFPK